MSSNVADLEPVTRGLCKLLLARWEEGMHPPIRVTQTMRTMDEQLHLYQQGRTLIDGEWVATARSRIVTKAKPGESAHNYGAAFDVCFIGADPYLHAHEVEHNEPDPLWALLGAEGTRIGLVWGGDWNTFKDRPHFERRDWRTFKPTGAA